MVRLVGDYENRHTAVTDVTAATFFVVTFVELRVKKKNIKGFAKPAQNHDYNQLDGES